jgi:flagellar hook protein FlgE
MSIFGALFTAVSGLSAQSQAMGMISNNIANVSTVGYKSTDASFESLVTNQSGSTEYSSGAVNVTQNNRIDIQGILQQSSSATDLAVSGNGFFVVKNSTTDPNAETLFTRAGSFSEDQNGNLVNTAGYNLYGYQLDQNGAIVGSPTSLTSLVPINVAFPNGLTQPTSTVSMTANLDSNQAADNQTDFTRDITVYDSLGDAHTLTAQFQKLPPADASTTGTMDLSTLNGGNFQPGTDVIDVTNVNGTTQVTLNGNVNKLLTDLNAISGISAHLNANNQLVIEDTTGDPSGLTLADDPSSAPDTPLETALGITPNTYTPTDYTPSELSGVTPTNPTTSNGWWQVSFVGQGVGTNPVLGDINFNSDGSLNAQKDISGNVNVQLGAINWGNGSDPQTLLFNMANIDQNAGPYNVASATQNGTPLGYKTGVSVSSDGKVNVQFSNGLSKNVYQLALGTFPDTDGLTPVTGNVFRISDTSGNVVLNAANSGGAGTVTGGALEESNVDIATEFSKMIVTQQAYSANSKVIQTADQMTQALLNINP